MRKKTKSSKSEEDILVFDVIDKDSVDRFNELIKKKHAFVQFYSPTCGYCHALEPEWDRLTATLKKRYNGDIIVVRVRSDMMEHINADKQIAGFPTIFVLEKGKKINEFKEKREARSIIKFCEKKFQNKKKKNKRTY